MKINEIIRLSDAFAAEVNVLRDFSYRDPEGNELKIKGYLPNKSSRDIIKSIFKSCAESVDKKLHLITASYGTGKSYLLLMLGNLLVNQNEKPLYSFIEKINDKENFYRDGLSAALDNHLKNSDPFLIVIPEYGDSDFDHALLEGLKFALQNNGIDYVPKTNYEEVIKIIYHWKVKSPENYGHLKDFITNSTIEKFIEQLQAYNPSTYSEFKKYFREIIGAPYPETYTSAYPIFADTAKEIRKRGFRGITIIYDEFGEMLGKLINSSSSATGVSVQQFLEDVKDKKGNSNIIFISASHQDPQSLRANKGKELNKIIGRFERYQLMVSETEGEELMGAIFIKEDMNKFKKAYKHPQFQEHLETINEFRLYPDKDTIWIENKVLKNLYPLHPLTSYILPRLSAEFAQNTRSMFNFLSPTETKEGAFKYYLESENVIIDGKLNLFTPDLLLNFFLKNIREDKEGRVQSLYEVYRVSIGRVNDPHHLIIMKNLFMLWVVSMASIQPKKETLFWAMNWEESRRKEFYNLLDDLMDVYEYIELNPIDETYHFPDFGAAPLSKVIDEEAKKLDDLTLSHCLKTWDEIVPLEDFLLRDHNNRFGCNRTLYTTAVVDVGYVITYVNELKGFYNCQKPYIGNGYLFYLVASSEDELEELKTAIKNVNTMLPYIVYASPVNLLQFDFLIKETLHFKAIKKTAARPDVMQNPSRLKTINELLQIVTGNLEEKIKDLYDPANWKWNCQEDYNIGLTTKPKLSNWINAKMDHLFSETPTIKDEALWYIEGNKGAKDRKLALDLLFNAEKDRLLLRDDDKYSAHKRIIRNFFAHIGITTDKKREKSIQYGEIKLPDQDSQVYKVWKQIDNKLESGKYENLPNIINPLLQKPFGLSVHIIKFLMTAYIRYDIERINIADAKRKIIIQPISLDVIEDLFSKPADFVIRKIEMSGPEFRYLRRLRTLFDKQDVYTWLDIAQKFIGIAQDFTPLHRFIIKDSGEKDLRNFYKSLDTLKAEYMATDSNKEKTSQVFFQEHLPSLFFNERLNIDDSSKVDALINKLDLFKKYPINKEAERKLEVIQALAEEVFHKRIVTKAEITEVVLNWFKNLPVPNQNGQFSDKIIKDWILQIKMPIFDDPIDLYLDRLNEKPIKDWGDFSYEKSRFISRFIGYKKTVEDYTKSPLEVLQIIARGVFEKTAVECETENAFDDFFKSWWDALPNLKKAEQYSPETNILISQISLPAAVKARYLETIPQAWKKSGYLAAHIPMQWEFWSNSDANTVAEMYHNCIQEVIKWKPPVEEKQLFTGLSKLFDGKKADSLSSLYAVVEKWKSELPERTKCANWKTINEHALWFIMALNEESTFRAFITEEAPSLWKLPEFKQWNEIVLMEFINKFMSLKTRIEEYKRPLFELVEKIEDKAKDKSSSTEAFCFSLYSKIINSDAYKNKIKTELLKNPISVILYNSARESGNGINLPNIILLISTKLNIDSDWHLWSDKEEKSFVTSLKKGIDNLIKWEFPEAEKLKKAKVKVKQGIAELQKELGLDDLQMRKVLNDILEDK